MSHQRAIRKRGFYRRFKKIGLPFPNYGIAPDELPILCRCYVEESSFYISHQQDMPTLYRNGSFGQSNITHRGPTSLFGRSHKSYHYFQKLKERTTVSDKSMEGHESEPNVKLDVVDGLNGSFKSNPENIPNSLYGNGIDLDQEDEKLILLPEEVIFLSFGVGCLSIQNSTTHETLSYDEIWRSLVQKNAEFPFSYAVYHYFRSKNWVPKDGHQYGGDYVLYQLGPDFYHSTYVVHIVGLPSRPRLTWCEVHALQRVAITSNKNVLLCEVKIPENFVSATSTPRSIFDFHISETVVNRWTPFGPTELQDD